jgi:hypothetical protein
LIFKAIGNFFDVFSQPENIFENIFENISTQYNIGLLTNPLQHIRDKTHDYHNFLCNDNVFCVVSQNDKMVGYDKSIINKFMYNKIIKKKDSHSSLLCNKKVLSKFEKFINK